MISKDGSRYEGFFKNDSAHGYGRLISENGDVYEGMWSFDKIDGIGTHTNHSEGIQYHGEWINNK